LRRSPAHDLGKRSFIDWISDLRLTINVGGLVGGVRANFRYFNERPAMP